MIRFNDNYLNLKIQCEQFFQTVAVAIWTTVFIFYGHFACLCAIYILFCTKYYYFTIIYIIWYLYDFKQGERGGREFLWVKKIFLWKLIRDYFPLRMIKTVDLNPNKNYICGFHPHGVLCFGPVVTFGSESAGIRKLFPNMKPCVCTISWFYYFPFFRELSMAMGGNAVSKKSITWLLTKKGKGNLVGIVMGGAVELLDAHPGTAKLHLKRRKGIIKIAIKTGTSLVPIFSFGENELYKIVENTKGSFQERFQNFMMNYFGFPVPLAWGRSFILNLWSYIPFRHPVDVVVGNPVDVVLNPNPTEEEINHYHTLYIKHIEELFESHKQNYNAYKNCKLEIV